MNSIFSNPQNLFSLNEILTKPCPIPKKNGLYGWFFKQIPAGVPVSECETYNELKLLYIGISPDKKGKPNSTQTLQHRIRYHYQGNAEGSTLRRSLGILLMSESGFPLRRVGSGKRMTFTNKGEQWLDSWMRDNAFVSWIENDEPWILEEELLHTFALPLNIQGNRHHSFAAELNKIRKRAIANAKEAPIFLGSENRKTSLKYIDFT
ncbi:hypothetical protein HGB07_06595 [Candidatus Roizmanbacteria bacterium]|nr:hypothetical protein [Candidatus Roizmanbacteria bacterium]